MSRSLAAIAACFLLLLPLGVSSAAPGRVKLPTEADASTLAPLSETILYGEEGIETLLPGPSEDVEEITMSLGADGVPVSIVADQKLTIHGVGDYFFKVSGPAMDVEATAASDAEPGLRRGSVLWQGFSEGETVLAARMPLFVEQEIERLPLETSLSLEVNGKPLELGERASGDFELTFTIDNVSESLTSYTLADGKPSELAATLDAIERVLRKGERPVPGAAGVPKDVIGGSRPETVTREVEMPFIVTGGFAFPSRNVGNLRATGAPSTKSERANGLTRVNFVARLGGGMPSKTQIRITGRAEGIRFPKLQMTARPAPPLTTGIPLGASSWREAQRRRMVRGREMFDSLMSAMWQVAKLRYFDAYLGNPDPAGEATSVYRYRMAQPAAAVGPPLVAETNVSPWTSALAVFALLFLLFDLALWWSLS
jgi:hypothetical protein